MTFRSLVPALVIIAAAAPPAAGQATPPTSTAAAPRRAAAIESARRMIADSMARTGVPGVSITVARGDEIVWSEGFGWADVEQRVAVTPLTRFRVGSVSKSLTSVALGRLVEQGRLDLDAPVQRYVPSFPAKRWPITPRQLAGHVAGIRHYAGDEFLSSRRYANVTEGLAIFRDDSLLFEPGTRYLYSTYGWNLLSAVVEGASGRDFLAYMRQEVFGPLGMRQTVPDFTDSLVAFRARFYTRADSAAPTVNAPYVDASYKWAGGGFLSTTEDLVRFGQALAAGRVLEPATRSLLFTSQRTKAGVETGYGIGWVVRRDARGRTTVSHSGGSTGGTAYLVIYPAERVVVAVLANSDMRFVGLTPGLASLFADATAP